MESIKKTFLVVLILSSFILKAQLKYPLTKKEPVIDTYHSIDIIDNYQWLENTDSSEVKKWIKEQNKVSLKYFRKLSNSRGSKYKMKELRWNESDLDDLKTAKSNNKVYFKLMYPGRNTPLSIFYAKGNKSGYQSLISAKSVSSKDLITFTHLTPSADDRFLAYQYNRNGSDWKEIKIVGIKKRKYFKEILKDVLSPQINWYGQGFFYVKNNYNPEKVRRTFPKLMYHKLDTEQSEDQKIFDVTNKDEFLSIYGTGNQSLYILKKSNKATDRFSYYYLKPNSLKKEFSPFFKDIKYDMQIVHYKSDTIAAITKINHKKYIIKFPLNEPKKWKLITPSYQDALVTDYELAENKIVTSFQTEKASILAVTNFNGKVLGEIVTPEGMSVRNLFYNEETKEFTFKLTSYTIPPVTCRLNLSNYTFEYIGKTQVSFDASKYKFMRRKFVSHDGKEVPMFIVYKDSIPKNGDTPFLLKTYGGYGSIAKPSFDPGIIYFIESGGAFAYVHIRGGGEFGYQWWQEGRKMKKKNGILDFTHAASYLVKEGLTKSKKIGVIGTSHGGLISAAAIIERPDLFGAAVINVGALDMIRMERTETGAAHVNLKEFGTVKKKDEFLNLHSYSPFHTIKSEVNYPATLVITGSNDTRVPPYQSYKFAGKLQNGLNQKNPILLWSQDKSGHYGARKYNDIIEESIYKYNFLINELSKNE